MSTPQYPEFIWQNGAIKPWAEATTHVMAHALHYGSSVFEGIRSYETPNGPAIFRLTDHLVRLFHSAKIYDIPMPYDLPTLAAAHREVLRRNGLGKGYLRPIAYRGLGGFGLSADCPTDVAIAAWNSVLALNVAGPFMLTQALLPLLKAAATLARLGLGPAFSRAAVSQRAARNPSRLE